MNTFYASVELLYHPELRDKPLAVGGDPELRHGIVLTKSQLAKKAGVKTGMALWQARQLCPEIVFIPPHYDRYMRFSRMAREIYGEYTDLVEPFGLDEVWADVSASRTIKGDGRQIAEEIRARIKRELGLTVSIGISWNKIFALKSGLLISSMIGSAERTTMDMDTTVRGIDMSEVNIEQITKEEIKVIVHILYDCVSIHSNFLLLFMKPKTIVTYILNDNLLNVTIK